MKRTGDSRPAVNSHGRIRDTGVIRAISSVEADVLKIMLWRFGDF